MNRVWGSRCHLIIIVLLVGATAFGQDGNGWMSLFNGENLEGWVQRNGEAEYRVENGEIVGVSIRNTPNSFLCTEEDFGDFILEFEVKLDGHLNSGVQFRSLSIPEDRNGRVHGYQMELDPSSRAWTGGVYDEARRGWLYPLTRNLAGQHAFRMADWNAIRIEAVGPHINTWVNGVQAARLVDDMTPRGFIALQVHSIGDDAAREGLSVRWRNLRILTEDLQAELRRPDPNVPEVSYLANELTEWEVRRGWRLLWDGKTTDGWRGARLDGFPQAGWEIENGELTVLESGGAESAHGGDIVTTEVFSDFELQLDFKITEGANSGIKYFVDPDLNQGSGSSIGLEYQILDDERHPDAKNGVGGNRTLASLYDLIPAANLSEGRRNKRENEPGSWNRARIVVRGSHVEHWLNNIKVVEFERGSQIYRALVQKSKYDSWENFGEAEAGHILLQDHGNTVSFRSIKIREF